MSYLPPTLLLLFRYIWFMGVWGTLVGVMDSATLAKGIGKYEYCSKGAGSHGSSNLGATMDGAQWLALCDKRLGHNVWHNLFFFSTNFKFTLSSAHVQGAKNSIADAISCTQVMQKLSPLIHQEAVDIPTPLRELVLDKRSDWKFQRWRESFSAI